MKIRRNKIYKVTSDPKEGKPILEAIHYNASKKRLEACNGWALAVCPVEDGGDVEALIPTQAFKDAHKMGKRWQEPTLTIANGQATPGADEVVGNINYTLGEGTFPDTQQIIPLKENLKFLVALDAKNLLDLAEAIMTAGALGGFPVELWLQEDKPHSPMLVIPVKPDPEYAGNFGVLMPVDAGDKNKEH